MKSNWKQGSSVVVSLLPIIGEGYDIATLINGKDPITGEQLGPFMKLVTVVGLMSGLGSGKVARVGMDQSLQLLSKELGVSVQELYRIAGEVASEYKFTNATELWNLKGKVSPSLIEQMIREKALRAHISMPTDVSTLGHIFRSAPGHLADTPQNRKLLLDVSNDPSALQGIDKYGTKWFASLRADKSQVWVQTRDGKITNGGLNASPKSFNPETGLSAH